MDKHINFHYTIFIRKIQVFFTRFFMFFCFAVFFIIFNEIFVSSTFILVFFPNSVLFRAFMLDKIGKAVYNI